MQYAQAQTRDADERVQASAERSQEAEEQLQTMVVRALRAEERVQALEAEVQSTAYRAQVAEDRLREVEVGRPIPVSVSAAAPSAPVQGTSDVRDALRRAQEAEARAARAEEDLELTKEQLKDLLDEEWEVKRELQQELRDVQALQGPY
jgi:hypothetical protein